MKRRKQLAMLAMAACCSLAVSAQTVKINGIGHNNRYNDGDQMKSTYLGWNSALGKAIFIVDNGMYTMTWNGTTLTTPVREPAIEASEVIGNNDKELWATNFNMMYGNSGAAYVNGKLVTVMSRDEQSTTDEELFAVRKWDAATGNLLDSRIFPKSSMLESAGMSYNPVDGKVYGLFYLTETQLSSEITEDPEYFSDDDDADAGREGMDAGYAICTIDLATMEVTPITPGLYYYNFVTFAINSEGRAFALTSGGTSGAPASDGKMYDINGNRTGAQLCEFDLTTGRMKTMAVPATDPETGESYTDYVNIYSQGTGYCSQYRRQSACFSKSNPNIMYWNGFYNSGKGVNEYGSWSSLSDREWRTNGKYDTSLYAVDITTGDATRLANIDNRWSFSCLWVSGDDPSDGADIDITNPDVKPDESAYIALSTADNGGIWQQVEPGKTYTYYVEPARGWKIHSVTFNNQDVTSNVTGNNMYTTPLITSQLSTLFVAFEPDTVSAVEAIERPASQVKVLGMQGGVRIVNAKAGDLVQVYSVDGRLLQSQTMSSEEANISLDGKLLYIIKVGEKVVKVRL